MKSLHIFLTLFFVSLAASAADVRSYMVWQREADLFQDLTLRYVLRHEDLVRADLMKEPKDWLAIQIGNKVYTSKLRNFKREDQIVVEFNAKIVGLDTRLERVISDLSQVNSRLLDLSVAKLNVERDKAVYVRTKIITRTLVPASDTNPGGGQGTTTVTSPNGKTVVKVPKITISYRHSPILDHHRQRRLLRDWSLEAKNLREKQRDLRKAEKNIISKKIAAVVRLEKLRQMFAEFEASPGSQQWDAYLVTKRKTPLFIGLKTSKEIDPGTAVLARKHREYRDWLHVIHEGATYGSSAKHYRSRELAEREMQTRVVLLELEQYYLEAELEEKRALQQLYGSFGLQLRYKASMDSRFGAVPDVFGQLGKISFYSFECPADAVQVIDRNLAKRVLRDWEKARKGLGKEIEKLQKRLDKLRKLQVETDARYAEIRRSLARALEAKKVDPGQILYLRKKK